MPAFSTTPIQVALRDQCRYYYATGSSLCTLLQKPMLGQLLMYTFRERYGTLLLRAFTTRDREVGATLLTREEEELYEVAREATRTFELWRRSSGCRIQALRC